MASSNEQIDWGHWILRLIAFIIDAVILAIVAAIIGSIIAVVAIFSAGLGFVFGWTFWLIWGLLSLLYFIVLDSYWGATIGKRLLGLQVHTLNGGRIPLDKSFIRNISKIFPLFLFLDWIVGIATPGDKRQKYMDRVAGVVVAQTRQSFASTSPPPPPPPPPPS